MLLGHYDYLIFVTMLVVGLYAVIAKRNYVKKILGLSIFQSAVFLLYISMGKVDGGTAPVLLPHDEPGHKVGPAAGEGDREIADVLTVEEAVVYSHPIPTVLILTAIVVGISTQALAFAIVVRIREEFGTVEGDELTAMFREERDESRSAAE
jgi:multicomponent Na+:H+ antiporter subunit C